MKIFIYHWFVRFLQSIFFLSKYIEYSKVHGEFWLIDRVWSSGDLQMDAILWSGPKFVGLRWGYLIFWDLEIDHGVNSSSICRTCCWHSALNQLDRSMDEKWIKSPQMTWSSALHTPRAQYRLHLALPRSPQRLHSALLVEQASWLAPSQELCRSS